MLPVTAVPVEKPLSLKNDGNLEIVFIGVGSAFARRNRQTNFLIVKGDHHIMVDFGMTGPIALEESTGLVTMDLEVMLPTHSHADHIGGIECMALTNRYIGLRAGKPKLQMIITHQYEKVIWDNSLEGGLSWNEELGAAKKKLGLVDFFDVIHPTWKPNQPREVFEVQFGPIKMELFRTQHIPDSASDWENSFISYGLYLDDHVFVSVDTRFDKELIDMYAHRSEVMFHDVQFFPGGVHAPLEALRTLQPDVKEKMFLMHYPDNWEQQNIEGFAGWTKAGVRYIFPDRSAS